MTTNSQLSATEPEKTKTTRKSKQLEQEQNQRNGDHGGLSVGIGRVENGGKGTGNKKHKYSSL